MDRSHTREIAMLVVGAGFVLGFFSMSSTVVGTDVGFRAPWNNHTPGELHFWVSWLLLLLPGAFLIGAALSGRLAERAGPLWARLSLLDDRERRVVLLLLFVAGLLAARLGNALVLLGFPVTDDEPAARLGGQILATGRFMLPLPQSFESLPNIFLFVNPARDAYASIDWIGVQLAWAFAEWTHTGSMLFAIAAALPVPLVALLLARRIGFAWGVVGGAMLLLSPMALTLSFTTHAHVLSRAWIAAALCVYVCARARLDEEEQAGWLFGAAGLLFAAAFVTRPFETGLLCAPLAVLTGWEAFTGEPRLRRALVLMAVGALPPLCLFAVHNLALTGHAWLPPRFAHDSMFTGLHRSPFAFLSDPSILWGRLGNNVSYNLMMLCLWFLGPLGIAAVVVGFGFDRFTRALGIGLAANLALGFLHDDSGLHIVGPIHYSESVVALAILAVHGLARARRGVQRLLEDVPDGPRLRRGTARVAVALGLASVIALGTFSYWHSRGLYRQAEIHERVFAAIDGLGLENAVLMAPPYAYVWQSIPEFAETGAWMFHWPHPDPQRSDRVIFVHDEGPGTSAERLAALRSEFAGRRFYALVKVDDDLTLTVLPIADTRMGDAAGEAARPGATSS